MPSKVLNLDARINTLKAVLVDAEDQQIVDKELQASKDDWVAASSALNDKQASGTDIGK